jgi:hypothetical protein
MATIAVFLALGGVSWAAWHAPRNSVGTRALKANSVTSGKVRNGTLGTGDFRNSFLDRKWPTAAKADSATEADSSANLAGSYRGYKRLVATVSTINNLDALNKAPKVPLVNFKGITVNAQCFYFNGYTYSKVSATASKDHTIVQSNTSVSSTSGGPTINFGNDGYKNGPGGGISGHSGAAIEPDGHGLTFSSYELISSTAASGESPNELAGPNAFPARRACIYIYEGRYVSP